MVDVPAEAVQAAAEAVDDGLYYEVTATLCQPCMDGEGGECHSPGCALWLNRAPDLPLWDNAMVCYRPAPAEADTAPDHYPGGASVAEGVRDDRWRDAAS